MTGEAAFRTRVAIVGGGVAGLMLANLLYVEGIDCVILERQTRAYTEGRIRAGVLEHATVGLLRRVGVDERMDKVGLRHEGFALMHDGEVTRIALHDLTGNDVIVYGQTEITIDLMDACAARGIPLIFEARDVALHDFDGTAPWVSYVRDGTVCRLDCDIIAGCDGFHGASRQTLPDAAAHAIEKVYPFGWLGILADVPPMDHELIYSNHERGFALASQRSPTRSRYYLQVDADARIDDWPDDRIWDELAIRLGDSGRRTTRGRSIEKSIAPLRSIVCEKMQHGRLFIAGDAAHIVPPTGAKGLNRAASDVAYLADALIAFYKRDDESGLGGYTRKALSRVWKAERFSWSMTQLTHHFPQMSAFDRKMQKADLGYIHSSRAAQTSIAENYIGLPY